MQFWMLISIFSHLDAKEGARWSHTEAFFRKPGVNLSVNVFINSFTITNYKVTLLDNLKLTNVNKARKFEVLNFLDEDFYIFGNSIRVYNKTSNTAFANVSIVCDPLYWSFSKELG